MIITIPNADQSLLAMLTAINQKLKSPYKIVKVPSKRLLSAINESEEILKNPSTFSSHTDIDELFAELENDKI